MTQRKRFIRNDEKGSASIGKALLTCCDRYLHKIFFFRFPVRKAYGTVLMLTFRRPIRRRMKNGKDGYIESLRGFTMLLVVASHVIGMDALGGMRVADDSIGRYLYYTLFSNYITMPLFTALAGWVYALRPVGPGHAARFLKKKAVRLLLPMVFAGTVYYLFQHGMPGTNHPVELSRIWRIYLIPYSIFWYLPALFLIFAGMAYVDARGLCRSLRPWALWMAASVALCAAAKEASAFVPNFFGIWGALALLPYFMLGVGMRRFRKRLSTPALRRLYSGGLVLAFAALQAVWFTCGNVHLLRQYDLHIPLSLIVAACMLTWRRGPEVPFLERIGHHAYAIYLFHVFGTAGGRIVLTALGLHSDLLLFACSLALGLTVPVVAEKLLDRIPLARLLFLGKRTPEQIRPNIL